MKKSNSGLHELDRFKKYLTRKNGEILGLILIIVCAISVFTGQISSKQTLTLDNGNIQYQGYVRANKMNGQGKLTFENGDSYEGEFKNGVFNGKGTFISSEGWKYEGDFKNGLADGQGKLTTQTKTVYEGTFKEGIYQHAD